MAEHVMKKYKAMVEKTVYLVEELEIICETEKEAEELLDDYCCDEHDEKVKIVEIEEQEVQVDSQWIEESSVLGVDEFMAYKDGLH
tara:strand:+ start:836 stop:1093 length:258 start_codon:yes stop_codon:yes gene_type:complete